MMEVPSTRFSGSSDDNTQSDGRLASGATIGNRPTAGCRDIHVGTGSIALWYRGGSKGRATVAPKHCLLFSGAGVEFDCNK